MTKKNKLNSPNKDSTYSNQQRELIKSKLISKYNISSSKAESIIINLENISKNNNSNQLSQKSDTTTSLKHTLNSKNIENDDLNNANNPENELNKLISKVILDSKHVKNAENSNAQTELINMDDNEYFQNETQNNISSNDVDSIISEIMPDYNYDTSIELENVNLTFEVMNEKIDTLKESIIRALRRNKSKKIKFKALNDISFKIYKGEKIGIIGYNGAGKSTLLRVITGIYPPDSGNVITKGTISPLLSLGAGFDYNYSGRKNIYLNGAVLGYDKDFLEKKEKEIIEFSELEEFIDFPIKNYSSGMLAKLGFSIATIVNPDILIIDEILSVGDASFHRKSADKIRSLMEGGTTVLLVSHSIPQIREICDKAIWIDKGKVRKIGEVNKICDEYLKDSANASKKQLRNIRFN